MRYVFTFFILFGFWLLLSGRFDGFHLTLGVLASALVSSLSADLLIREPDWRGRFRTICRFIGYLPWLGYEIILSTLHVAFLALHPGMREKIDPTVVTFKTVLTSDVARVALANSITLTPGTITIRIRDGVFSVHAISFKSAAGLPGEMERRLARVFEEHS